MFEAYEVVDQTPTHITYRYRSVCSYWVYGGLLLAFICSYFDSVPLMVLGAIPLLAYFALVYFPALKTANRLKAAIRMGMVEISGSRWSFSNPLTVRTPLTEEETAIDAEAK